MLKIDWHKLIGTWTIFGFYSTTLVEGGSMLANSNIVGYKFAWRWHKWPNDNSPNIFCTFDRAKAITNYTSPKKVVTK